MKNQFRKIGLVLVATVTLFSCTPNEEEIQIASPENVAPINGKSFSADEAQSPITFRWTPVVPKPQQPVTYRLRVWQLMQGQNSTEAMKTNQPIVTKDVDNITQAVIPGIYTGPCRPPYLCDYVWTVQAMDRNGTPIGSNLGTSNSTVFNF
jgi:hypothetical protein